MGLLGALELAWSPVSCLVHGIIVVLCEHQSEYRQLTLNTYS